MGVCVECFVVKFFFFECVLLDDVVFVDFVVVLLDGVVFGFCWGDGGDLVVYGVELVDVEGLVFVVVVFYVGLVG